MRDACQLAPPARMPHQPWRRGLQCSVGVTVRNPWSRKQVSGSLVLARPNSQNDHHKGSPSPWAIKKTDRVGVAWSLWWPGGDAR